jgi:hypothetical protein
VISFRPKEEVIPSILKKIEQDVCNSLNFTEHQRISVIHNDTDNLHIHIAINKIHPEKYSFHEPFRAYKALNHLSSVIEKKYGLQKDNHTKVIQKHISYLAKDMESHSAFQSLGTWIQQTCLQSLLKAKTWNQFHTIMDCHGLLLKKKANGFIIQSTHISIKASSIDPNLSKNKLELQLGIFQENQSISSIQPHTIYQKQPIEQSSQINILYAKYQQEQLNRLITNNNQKKELTKKKAKLFLAAKKVFQLKKNFIFLIKKNSITKKILLKQAQKQYHDSLKKIQKSLKQKIEKKQTWKEWLEIQQKIEKKQTEWVEIQQKQEKQQIKIKI